MTVSHDDEPILILRIPDPDAEGSFAEMLEFQEFWEPKAAELKAASESGASQSRLLAAIFEAIKPRLEMSDGSDPTEAIKRVSFSQVVKLLQTLTGQMTALPDDAVPPTNGVPSGGTPTALAAKSNGHRPGSKHARLPQSGTSRPG